MSSPIACDRATRAEEAKENVVPHPLTFREISNISDE